MPNYPGTPTQGAMQQAQLAFGGADRMRGTRFDLRQRTAQNLKMQRDQLIAKLEERKAERAAESAAREAEDQGMGGMIGAGGGMALAVVLAPFTAGASLALMGPMAAIGGGIGTAVEGGPGSSARSTQMIVGGATQIGGAFVQNPYYQRPSTPSSTPQSRYDGTTAFSTGFR